MSEISVGMRSCITWRSVAMFAEVLNVLKEVVPGICIVYLGQRCGAFSFSFQEYDIATAIVFFLNFCAYN